MTLPAAVPGMFDDTGYPFLGFFIYIFSIVYSGFNVGAAILLSFDSVSDMT